MTIYVIGQSATGYWRQHLGQIHDAARCRVASLCSAAVTAGELSRYNMAPFEAPDGTAHLIVDRSLKRPAPAGFTFHSWTGPVPPNSFVYVGGGVYVARPEFCFLQEAATLDRVQLLKRGMESCGSYDIAPSPYASKESISITSADKIEQYLAKADTCYGIEKARWASRYLVDGSASRPETAILLQLTLPWKRGGWAFEKPVMNEFIEVPFALRDMLRERHFAPDLLWPREGVAIEYNSNQDHGYLHKKACDERRRNILMFMGINVISVDTGQLRSYSEFSLVAHQLARALHRRIRASNDASRLSAQCGLRRKLLWDVFGPGYDGVR